LNLPARSSEQHGTECRAHDHAITAFIDAARAVNRGAG